MRSGYRTAILKVALASACLVCARAFAEDPTSGAGAPRPRSGAVNDQTARTEAIRAEAFRRQALRRYGGGRGVGVEDRVRAMAKVLDLDPKQQIQLRKLLEFQQETIKRVWADPSIPAADHVGATRAILDQTRDKIRAMLNDEQRKKYPARSTPRDPGAPQPDVEYWMRLTQQKEGDHAPQAL